LTVFDLRAFSQQNGIWKLSEKLSEISVDSFGNCQPMTLQNFGNCQPNFGNCSLHPLHHPLHHPNTTEKRLNHRNPENRRIFATDALDVLKKSGLNLVSKLQRCHFFWPIFNGRFHDITYKTSSFRADSSFSRTPLRPLPNTQRVQFSMGFLQFSPPLKPPTSQCKMRPIRIGTPDFCYIVMWGVRGEKM
jgi:hypothetical protein